jgi:hypothetical protein
VSEKWILWLFCVNVLRIFHEFWQFSRCWEGFKLEFAQILIRIQHLYLLRSESMKAPLAEEEIFNVQEGFPRILAEFQSKLHGSFWG